MAGQAEIGALRVRLAMDVGKFIQNTRRARRASNSMAKRMGKAFAGLGASALASAGVVARAASRVADNMDMLNKKARTAGVSAEFFQTLKFAAIEAGVEQKRMEKSLETLLKRVGEARLGLGPLASKLKEYDENLFEAIRNTRSQEEAMRLLADATRRESDAANRGALTAAAFSKANMQMLRIMEQGSDVFDRTTKKARRFNAIIGQDVLDDMSQLNNRMGVATEQISQNWSAMVSQMMKENVDLQESIARMMKTVREFFFSLRDVQQLPLTDARRILGETEKDITRIREQMAKLRSGEGQGPAAQMGATEKMSNLQSLLNEKLEKQRELAAHITGLSQRRLKFEQQANEVARGGEDGEGVGGFDTETVESATMFNDQVNRGIMLMDGAITPMERYREQIAAIKAAQDQGIGNTEKWNKAQQRAALMVASEYAGLAGNVAGSMSRIFGESKGWAIAEAVINTAQAVTRTLAVHGATPWGWANAAAAAAAGAAEIATIQRTTKGGGGGGSTSRASGGASAGGAQGDGRGGGGVRQVANITLQGQTFGREQV
ncbi:MAG: hypothetical protein ACLFPA_13400, partial [Dichotomicrobium sp.]